MATDKKAQADPQAKPWSWGACSWFSLLCACLLAAPASALEEGGSVEVEPAKPVVYQVMTRLFGNQNTTNKPWGTIEENGVGKFADFSDTALEGIRELGVTHIWYTGVPHHAVIRDYSRYGIGDDDPDVVKGRAGSPYAVKDYYNVNPDLAVDPAKRLQEFRALVERTHAHGMKVVIDIVPNHVARNYGSLSLPPGAKDLGSSDDPTVEWRRDNHFYYVPGKDFVVPEPANGYRPLGGATHPRADGKYTESPARWTGNGARSPQPKHDDWYETIRINYGVRPDGSHAFDELPVAYGERTVADHLAFWQGRDVPDSWERFRDIALYWLDLGVDGFRFDMAEMVPVAFWSYLNSAIKAERPDAFLLAEIYQPALYRDFIRLGKMDYLYDKVGLYDTLRAVVEGRENTDAIVSVQRQVLDIEGHMLHFLENHDEQRIASPGFAGDAGLALPAMTVSALIGSGPTLLYFGQEVGEEGAGDAGFGDPTRTTIFDYWGVPAHQRWMNGGRFDGGALTPPERGLREFYRRLLSFSASSIAVRGEYAELHTVNRAMAEGYDEQLFAFARWQGEDRLIVVANFDRAAGRDLRLVLPDELVQGWQLQQGRYSLTEALFGRNNSVLEVDSRGAQLRLRLEPLESVVLELGALPDG